MDPPWTQSIQPDCMAASVFAIEQVWISVSACRQWANKGRPGNRSQSIQSIHKSKTKRNEEKIKAVWILICLLDIRLDHHKRLGICRLDLRPIWNPDLKFPDSSGTCMHDWWPCIYIIIANLASNFETRSGVRIDSLVPAPCLGHREPTQLSGRPASWRGVQGVEECSSSPQCGPRNWQAVSVFVSWKEGNQVLYQGCSLQPICSGPGAFSHGNGWQSPTSMFESLGTGEPCLLL